MNQVEKKYRDTPISNPKYTKHLSNYINLLQQNGRVLEAKHFFQELLTLKPKSTNTYITGYKLAIKTFDNQMVERFDNSLMEKKSKTEILHCLRLEYYYSVNNQRCFGELLTHMLTSPRLSENSLALILQLVLEQSDYQQISSLFKYLKTKNKYLNKAAESKVRKVVLQRLVDSLVKVTL